MKPIPTHFEIIDLRPKFQTASEAQTLCGKCSLPFGKDHICVVIKLQTFTWGRK